MRTDNPLNDAIHEMNRLDAIDSVETFLCFMCEEEKENCEYVPSHNGEMFGKHWYCPQCLQELKTATN